MEELPSRRGLMEGRSILLANINIENGSELNHRHDILISPSLKYILFSVPSDKLYIYNLSKDFDYDHKEAKVLWKENLTHPVSVCFSRDNKGFAVFTKSSHPKVAIYSLTEQEVNKTSEASLTEILQQGNTSLRSDEDICGSCDISKEADTLIHVQKNNVVLYSSGTLHSFHILPNRECVQSYVVSLESSSTIFHFNSHSFYNVVSTGVLYIYQLEDGNLSGIFDIYRVLPNNIQISQIYVNAIGNWLAILGGGNKIYVLDISNAKVPPSFSSHQPPSGRGSSSSVSSFKTSISKISSRVDSIKREATTRKISSIANATSATSNWLSYLQKLRNPSKYKDGAEEESSSFICISDIPTNFIVQSLHFFQDNLGVWATSQDNLSEGFYRVYDVLTGRLQSADILAPDTRVVSLDSLSVSMDLLLHGNSLSLPLGIISREMLIQKMVGGESESLVGGMVGQVVLPLPLLQEGLANHQLDMVRLAFNLHTQGFKSKLSGDCQDELVDSTKQLFEAIRSADGDDQWKQQICRLALTHANTLLSLLPCPSAQDLLLIQILNYIALLRRRDVSVPVDLPIVVHWTPWLPLSDHDVILEGVFVSLPLVQCFLAIHRGWEEEDIHGKRFHGLVLEVVTKLLKKKELNRARDLLTKVNLEAEEEFRALCLTCRDPELRDYLVDSLSDNISLEVKSAWQFLSLVETVLTNHQDCFPSFVESPLTISDVLLLSEKEKSQIMADLFFSTGENNLKAHLDKDTCWEYLLEHNNTEGILVWLSLKSAESNFDWPLELFSQWKVDQTMVDKVLTADCTELTRHIVFNELAKFGIHPSTDLKDPRTLLLRMANAQIFPDEKQVLDQKTATLTYHQYREILLKHAIEKNLIEVVVKSDLDNYDFDSDSCPDWLKLFKTHREAGKTLSQSDILQAIESCSQYLASLESVDQTVYLKQHPLVAVVTEILKNQNVCQSLSHVSPLLAAALPVERPTQDIDLYSVLAHTVPFHTDNIFKHQLSKKRNTPLPDFTNENLILRYGVTCSLGFKEFLKQGRPASAFSFIMQKERTSSKKAAVRYAHGLALSHAEDLVVTSACVAFVELLGKNSNLLRTHVAVARELTGHLDEKTLRELLFDLVRGKEGTAAQLLAQLESRLLLRWQTSDPGVVGCLRQFHLAVRFAVYHRLPPPTALLRYSLETENWLLFVLTIQLFQYPLSEVQEVCSSNSKHVISEHLFHSLHSHTRSQTEDKETYTFESETNLFGCLAQYGNDVEKLFSLSRQLNSPALALLASSIQLYPAQTGLCHWLVASLPAEMTRQCPDSPWTPDHVTRLLELVISLGYLHTFARGFAIFQPDNPFHALGDFLVDSVVNHKFKESIKSLKIFMEKFKNLSNEDDQESGFLKRKSWVAITAYRVVCSALAYCFPSGYLRHCFLEALCEEKFSETVQGDQSLPLYLRLSQCLMPTQLQLDWKRLCLDEDLSQLAQTLHSLTEQHMFDTAFKFARVAGLPCDNVLVTQWSVLASSTEPKESDFWNRCEAAFQQANIDPVIALNFYQSEAATSDNLQERYVLLKYALGWMLKTSVEPETITELQAELYTTCLQESFKTEVITEGVTPAPLRCLSHELVTAPRHPPPPALAPAQTHRLDSIIHQLLAVGDIRTAFVLQSIFHHVNQDCELLLACMRLAERVESVAELPARIQEYLSDESVRRPKTKFTSPLPKMRSKGSLLQSDSQSVLTALYALQAHQTCATALFSNIIHAFKVSLALGCDYKEIILDSEPLNRLQVTHDYEVATGLLNLASLTRYECAQYVCSQVVSVLTSEPVEGRYILWSCELDSEFSCILELSGSALLLGNLLIASDPLVSSHASTYRQGVELLVLAHSCFTKVCHMEGISSVLNLARSLTCRLLSCSQWPLMVSMLDCPKKVRLLTGISRYTEMSYIFQILKDNDQFEYLLGKGLDKHPQLMAATLEFVRHDKELFSLVAHHFSMYSELAALYEEEARTELGKVEIGEAGLVVSPQNKACLQTVMSKYSDATEHYMQAKKMKCGVASVQKAELIAVQLSLMTNTSETHVPCLINLTQDQVVHLINTVLSCEQAHIVASAYNLAVDWSAALYHNCVVKGDSSYLTTWTRHHELTKTVVQDVVRRFQSERDTGGTEGNMRWFVSSVGLLDVKYRVASQLGFKDILQHLLTSPDMAYLKDTVWQSGFKNQLV